jgi:hypothetical protein
MGITKTEIYTGEQNKLAVQLKAIAHPARIAILQELIKANACICGDLVEELGLAQGTIEGVSICYCIEPKAWKDLQNELNLMFASYNDTNNCC